MRSLRRTTARRPGVRAAGQPAGRVAGGRTGGLAGRVRRAADAPAGPAGRPHPGPRTRLGAAGRPAGRSRTARAVRLVPRYDTHPAGSGRAVRRLPGAGPDAGADRAGRRRGRRGTRTAVPGRPERPGRRSPRRPGPGALTRADLGLGDAHQGNRAVAVLHFASGDRIVYKPRPLEQHALLDDLVGWLNTKVPGLGLRSPRSVRRDGYGWLEFVAHRWCRSVAETDAFYRRQGALLALLYAVDGADMHYENVIACGDQPVLVDAETLLHTGLPPAMTAGADPAADALHASVHRTCLLPHLLIGEHGALDISALGRSTDGTYPSEGLRWEDSGTDTMRAVRARCSARARRTTPARRPSAGRRRSPRRPAGGLPHRLRGHLRTRG
ncbi:DUF4135 domain-containing protein [Streptomyces diastatochromogenes]|nr:DUF4135 domain-containing protein [Streptomyces diastatochromogenes]